MKYKTRTVALTGSRRTTLKMTEEEWGDVERLADALGMRWLDWAREAVESSPHLAKVEAIRKAITEARAAEKTGDPTDEACEHELVRHSRFVGDDDLTAILDDFREVWAVHLGACVVRYGYNKLTAHPYDDPMMIIENRLKGELHVAFGASYGSM